MFKRVTIVALVVAAFVLIMAVPAFSWNGMREDYSIATSCQGCHSNGNFGAPIVYQGWSETKHGEDEAFSEVANRVPTGSVCQGCHTANFDPAKMTPTPTATTYAYASPITATSTPTATSTAWGYATDTSGNQSGPSAGNGAWSEPYIGCSSCHYGAEPISENDGRDASDTAHKAPLGEMANADICGTCHSRYSYTVDTYTILPIPTPSAVSVIQPQMALGTETSPWKFLGQPGTTAWTPAAALSTVLNIPHSGWTPTPTATTAGSYTAPSLMTYWKTSDGQDTPWQLVGHDGSAAQYPEWAGEGHAAALTALTSMPFWSSFTYDQKAECLECHSADFRILKEAGKLPQTAAEKAAYSPRYGITCAGCHAPHEAGTVKGVWDEEFDAQLVDDANLGGNGSNLCTECHNGEIPAGSTASPGAEVHHPMKEMMDGYGAIDVQAFPSVHKGKCIQCHMPPTSYSRGSIQMGGNHTFGIITPGVANDTVPIPIASATTRATATPVPTDTTTPLPLRAVVTTTITKTQDSMPYSACSTCHNNNQKPTPVTVSSVSATVTPTATASPIQVTTNIVQNVANQGDKALWLQDTIDQRQSWTKAKVDEIWAALETAAHNLGYADTDAAHTALIAMAPAERTTAQTAFLIGFTNVEYVQSEGSFGLHNWDYSRAIVNKAMEQALVAQTGVTVKLPWVVTLKLSKSSIKAGAKVKFTGTVMSAKNVAGAGSAKIMKRVGGVWKVWKNATVANGTYSLTVKMTKKGTFYFRTLMPEDSLNKANNSGKVKLVVK